MIKFFCCCCAMLIGYFRTEKAFLETYPLGCPNCCTCKAGDNSMINILGAKKVTEMMAKCVADHKANAAVKWWCHDHEDAQTKRLVMWKLDQ